MYVTLKYNRDFQIKWSYPSVRTQTQTHICIQTGTPIELQIQTQTTHTPTHTDTHTYSHNIDPIFIYITYWFWALEHQISESCFFLLWGNSDQVGHIWPKWNLKMGHFWSLFLIKRGGCKFPEKVGEVLGICLAIFFLKNIDFKNCILCGAKLDFRP